MANNTSETFETERTFDADPDTVWEAITERIMQGTMMFAGAQLSACAR